MSHLKYFNYPGWGDLMADTYSQAVRVGDRIECSGQGTSPNQRGTHSVAPFHDTLTNQKLTQSPPTGGWDPVTGELPADKSAADQIEQAFKNVDIMLRHAGASKGWGQVYRVNSYHCPLDKEVIPKIKEVINKWCPDHKPTWTCIGVTNLGLDAMKVEIEVVAHVGN